MSVHVTTNIHIEDVDGIEAHNSGRCVWVEIGSDVTIFVRNVEQVNAIVQACYDAATIMRQNDADHAMDASIA